MVIVDVELGCGNGGIYLSNGSGFAVIAIGRNEGDRLRRCLLSIPLEVPVIYVDSASSDDSVSFALTRGADVVQLGPLTRFTAALARNAGFARLMEKHPRLPYVQFVDGDCEFERGWLESARAFLHSHPNAAVVCGRRRERFREASLYNRLCDEEWDTPTGRVAACGGDAMFRAKALVEVGGYDSALAAGEEPELCARLRMQNWSVWRIDQPMTIHDAAMHHFSQWWIRAIRSGYGYAQVWHKTTGLPTATLYGRELARAVFWSAAPPLTAVVLSLYLGPAGLLLAPLIWGLQLTRLTVLHGARKGVHLLIGKIAECLGAAKYLSHRMLNRQIGTIFYK